MKKVPEVKEKRDVVRAHARSLLFFPVLENHDSTSSTS
jgi:hypothetical protein